MTPLQGFGMGKTTSPAHDGMTRSIDGAGAVTKDFVLKGREAMMEEMMRLEMEMQQYEILLKRAKLKAMQIELEKLSPQNNFLNNVGVYYSRIPVWVSPVWDRVWVTHFLASAMIISHAFAAGGPPSPCSSIYIRLHPQEPTKMVAPVSRSTSTSSSSTRRDSFIYKKIG